MPYSFRHRYSKDSHAAGFDLTNISEAMGMLQKFIGRIIQDLNLVKQLRCIATGISKSMSSYLEERIKYYDEEYRAERALDYFDKQFDQLEKYF